MLVPVPAPPSTASALAVATTRPSHNEERFTPQPYMPCATLRAVMANIDGVLAPVRPFTLHLDHSADTYFYTFLLVLRIASPSKCR